MCGCVCGFVFVCVWVCVGVCVGVFGCVCVCVCWGGVGSFVGLRERAGSFRMGGRGGG